MLIFWNRNQKNNRHRIKKEEEMIFKRKWNRYGGQREREKIQIVTTGMRHTKEE